MIGTNDNFYAHKNKNNICVLLTMNVTPADIVNNLLMRDPATRLDIYLKSIKQWLTQTELNIVIVENSNYPFPELQEELVKYKHRFEIISCCPTDLSDINELSWLGSKGIHEAFAINYAKKQSKMIKSSIFIIKITGRYFVPEFENYINNIKLNEYYALTQHDNTRCEIVGAHSIYFDRIFYQNFIDNNNDLIGHAETIYKQRIEKLPKNKTFVCKLFQIESTMSGNLVHPITDL